MLSKLHRFCSHAHHITPDHASQGKRVAATIAVERGPYVREDRRMAGVTLNVRVTPGAQSTRVDAWDGKKVSLRVSAAAEKGKANEAALRLLAGVLGVPVTSLRLVRGQTSRDKLVAVEGLTEDEARQRVERHLADRAGSRKGAG